jgi:formyl-CoA transferase
LRHIDALDDLIQGHIARLTLQEALAFFAERDITAGPVCDVADLLDHPYMADRQLLVEQTAPDGRKVLVHAAPYKINGSRPPIRRTAPTLGQDDARWLSPTAVATEETSS